MSELTSNNSGPVSLAKEKVKMMDPEYRKHRAEITKRSYAKNHKQADPNNAIVKKRGRPKKN